MIDNLKTVEVAKRLGKNQKILIKSLFTHPIPIRNFSSDKDANLVAKLQDRGLVSIKKSQLCLTLLGKEVCSFLLQEADNNQDNICSESSNQDETQNKLSKRQIQNQEKFERSSEFLQFYKQGLSYQNIGDKYEISRERVRQILNFNPEFHEYLKEREEIEASVALANMVAETEKAEQEKQELYLKSLGVLYQKQVAQLWDYEKNGELKPEEVLAGSTSQSIWLRCPFDGHSWEKLARAIAIEIWERKGTTGCPVCAGKTKKSEKQLTLLEVYPELVSQYWNYEKNNDLGLDPAKVTLGSNKKVWFNCPHDGNDWQVAVAVIVNQQWSKNNAGCRVCNGTDERKRGEWKRGEPIAVEFSNEIAKYWNYEKNNELKIDPMKVTTGSAKRAWFKCPIDSHEWQATITGIAKTSWDRGNSGCPACRGLAVTESSSLVALYPDYVATYWDYEKNNELGLYPNKLSKGSQKEAWFKCPHDGYQWKTTINSITRASWKIGNSGCTRCNYGWTLEAIRQFIASLEEHIPNLTQAERYKIFEQSGLVNTTNVEGLKIVKDIIKGKLSGQKLRDVLQSKEIKTSESEVGLSDALSIDTELQVVDAVPLLTELEVSNTPEKVGNGLDQLGSSDELPKVKVKKSLEFLSSEIVASADEEAINFFIASRRNRIWAEVFEDESAVEGIEVFIGEGYGRQVRDQFLDEYNQARDMPIPAGWGFRLNGKITPPNLMQKLAAVRLRSQKRMLNLSLTGTGKTIGGILSSRLIDANLSIIICPLDTVQNWHGEIKHVFPDSKVTIKSFNPYWTDLENAHHYIILNHEMFQQPSTSAHIRQLLERYKIDLIIVDEVHRCKQRGDDPSKRRQMVMALISNATEKNSNLHVLGMSATPVINNLKEGKSLIELVTGVERSDLSEKATLNNCMRLYEAFVTLGIRSRVKPKITINRKHIPIDCTHLVDEIRKKGTSVLKMEQILTRARIPAILKELQPKTIIYTHYVEGIVEQLKEAVEAAGWTVGFHIGGDKSGRNSFIDGSTDILIASSAMAVGVDGFQRICDRLILNISPWTSAELEQLEGRLNRQGQRHETLTIIMPVTYGFDYGEQWSWDEGKLARLQNKQTIADAAVDGVMPEGQLRTESQAFRDLRGWLDRLKTGEQKSIVRPRIFVPLPDRDPVDVQRRNVQYGDFSRMNARWNNSYSHTTYRRLQENSEEWMQYHTLYQEARKTWNVIPYEEAIKWLQKRSDLVVGDFGCGEALLAKTLAGRHTIHSFDFIAINESVIECDMAHLPLEDGCLDVAMFNLSLMGLNIGDYISEAARTLKLDGQLWIYEVASHFKNIQQFIYALELAGFKIIDNLEVWKFQHIRAIKSEEVDLTQFHLSL